MARTPSKRRSALKQLKNRRQTADHRSGADAPPQPHPRDPQQQVELALQRFAQTSPRFKQNAVQFRIDQQQVVDASLVGSGVHDLSPLRGMALRRVDLQGLAVHDLSPLAGMPVEELYLEDTRVTDLSPLAGMPLRKLHMSQTPTVLLDPLKGAPLVELNLLGTQVSNVSAIAQPQLHTLWLNGTKVDDVTPLAEATGLVSLTLADTPVSSLAGLANLKLQRLHIAGTQVRDLTPIAGLPLTRLIFTPDRIEAGLEQVRTMPSLQEVGMSLEQMMPPAQFWAMVDASAQGGQATR